ncbi:hypothetical protein TWF106_010690 [Orbilia oligospora]|uniref:MADS-box domain-containing protein n=1 Tax=Orbilia oligospora TaxID=2813651 RepID=A0A7C8UQH0_ORBOL|nr:hypothetical protein TWF106_010690 [Orbilia oligospora]
MQPPLESSLVEIKERYDRATKVVQFRKRRNGLMKKARVLHALTGAAVAVFIEKDNRRFVFNTTESLDWVVNIQNTQPPPEFKGIQDFNCKTTATRTKKTKVLQNKASTRGGKNTPKIKPPPPLTLGLDNGASRLGARDSRDNISRAEPKFLASNLVSAPTMSTSLRL